MGRRKIYTAEEKKLIKSYRNKIYYYGRKLKDMMASANNQMPGGFAFRYDYKISFHNIRQAIGPIDDSKDKEGILLPLFRDDSTYYFEDFRQVGIDEGGDTRDVIDEISQRLGYGSLEDYEKQQKYRSELHEATEAYESLRTLKMVTSTFDVE